MDKLGWKILAIVFIVMFAAETIFVIWAWSLAIEEEKQLKECYYDICAEHPYAELDGDICFCYDYDMLGDLILDKTIYMRD